MYNEDMPRRADLPSTRQLLKSTALAFVSALILLVTVILPSEYALDPTGVGTFLGLTEMGVIKQQLATEAEQDRHLKEQATQNKTPSTPPASVETLSADSTVPPKPKAAPTAKIEVVTLEAPAPVPDVLYRDQVKITLSPGQGTEWKLVMQEKGMRAFYKWSANGSQLNYDTHGDGNGQSISYEKGRGVSENSGELVAAFAGNHGWFFRNRTPQDVTLTLKTWGDYAKLKKTH